MKATKSAYRDSLSLAKAINDANKLKGFIEQSGECTASDLARKFRGITSEARQAVLDDLLQAGTISVVVTMTEGRPQTLIRFLGTGE